MLIFSLFFINLKSVNNSPEVDDKFCNCEHSARAFSERFAELLQTGMKRAPKYLHW